MKKINWNKHLFRASGNSNLMAGVSVITEEQLEEIRLLEEKAVATTKLTDKQQADYEKLIGVKTRLELSVPEQKKLDGFETKMTEVKGLGKTDQAKLDKLIHKRDVLELSTGAKTFLRKLYREVKFKRRAELKNKYVSKGNANENEAIDTLSFLTGDYYENNTDRVNNKFCTGECDILPDETGAGRDIKNSWSLDTFPWHDTPLDSVYEWQNHTYMDLYKAKSWITVYVLTNLNDEMIADEIRKLDWQHVGEVPNHKKLEILNRHIYDDATFFKLMEMHNCKPREIDEGEEPNDEDILCADIVLNFTEIPPQHRIVEKTTVRDDKKIALLHEMIKLARKYLVWLEGEDNKR
jgi:hypothetical protein